VGIAKLCLFRRLLIRQTAAHNISNFFLHPGDPAGRGGGARQQERRAHPEQGPGEEDQGPGAGGRGEATCHNPAGRIIS
jgi:hypothetical protein